MPTPKPALIVVPLLIITLGVTSYIVEGQRSHQRSALTGFFESQPTAVSSRVQGRIVNLLVREGDMVHAGQLLATLETNSLEQDTRSKSYLAEQANQLDTEMRNGPRDEDIQKQEAAVEEAKANLDRLQNGPLPEEIEEARARMRHAEAQYQKMLAGPRPEEIAGSRADERNTRARLAQAERGLTIQERAEARARLDSAISSELLAKRDADRFDELFRQDAISKQQADQKRTEYETAVAKRHEMEQAWRLADTGTPKEEMEQARQAHEQSVAALNLMLDGYRKEDISSAHADVNEARKALDLLLRGYRSEDIRAAEAHLKGARAALEELKAGNRKEEIRQAHAASEAARSAAASTRSNLTENAVRSPIDGIVERIPVALGDLVSSDTTVVKLANPTDIWLRIYVPEANMQSVAPGTKGQIRIDGIATPLNAVVESVSTQGEFTPANLQTPDDRGKQVFGVRMRLTPPDTHVKAGMAATVIRIGSWKP